MCTAISLMKNNCTQYIMSVTQTQTLEHAQADTHLLGEKNSVDVTKFQLHIAKRLENYIILQFTVLCLAALVWREGLPLLKHIGVFSK